jgi:hypothetical protein
LDDGGPEDLSFFDTEKLKKSPKVTKKRSEMTPPFKQEPVVDGLGLQSQFFALSGEHI